MNRRLVSQWLPQTLKTKIKLKKKNLENTTQNVKVTENPTKGTRNLTLPQIELCTTKIQKIKSINQRWLIARRHTSQIY